VNYNAILTTESKNPESVSKALDVDNIWLSGLSISTKISGGRIETKICSETLPTLLSTLDDLIRCQMMAEGLV
jgi:hypothetical protein